MSNQNPDALKIIDRYIKVRSKSEADYLSALERLKHQEPRNKELSLRASLGKPIKITPSTVAKEAGKSRNPLYTNFRHILNSIEETRNNIATGTSGNRPSGLLKHLREQVSELKREKALLATQLAELSIDRDDLTKQLESERRIVLQLRIKCDKLTTLKKADLV